MGSLETLSTVEIRLRTATTGLRTPSTELRTSEPASTSISPIDLIFGEFTGHHVTSTPTDPTSSVEEEVGHILNPFRSREELENGTSCELSVRGGISYDTGLLVQIVYIPSFILLLLSSIFLIYAILTLLRPLLKIYLSVLFYASCQLFLAATLLLSILSSQLFNETEESCLMTGPVQAVGMILPGYAVLAITVVRYFFLRYPMEWRSVLTTTRQMAGFGLLIVAATLLSLLPNFGLCGYTLYTQGGITQCRYADGGTSCATFYALFISLGFVFPPFAVIILYGLIYRIITRHNAFRAESEVRTKTTSSGGLRAPSVAGTSTVAEDAPLDTTVAAGKSEKTKRERARVPWSILIILGLSILSTVPWIPQALYPELFYGCQSGEVVLAVDIMWSVLVVSTGLSPVAYLLTTRSVREQIAQWGSCLLGNKDSSHCLHATTEHV